MPDPLLDDLAEAVLDREVIDWSSVSSRVQSDEERRAAEALRRLSLISSGTHDTDLFSNLRRRLPVWIEMARVLAIVQASVGLVGTAIALRGLDITQPSVALVPFIFAVLVPFVAASVLLDISARDRRARTLALSYWTIAAAFAAGGVTWLKNQGVPGIWLIDGLRPEVFLGASLWLFAREFPRTTRYSPLDTLSRAGFRVAGASGVTLLLLNVGFGPLSHWLAGVPASLHRSAAPGGWFWNIHFAIALPALIVVALRSRLAPAGEVARVRLFLTALVLAIAPVAALVVVTGVFPDLARRIAQDWQIASAWIVYPPIVALPFITMYAVTATNVLPARLVIRAGVRYVVSGHVLFGLVVIPAAWLLFHVYGNRQRPLVDVLEDGITTPLAWALLVSLLLMGGRRAILKIVERWARADPADPGQVFARLATTLKDARTPFEVSTLLAAGAEQAFQAPTERYIARFGRLAPVGGNGLPLPDGSLIPILLRSTSEPCLIGEDLPRSLFRFLSAEDQTWVSRSGTAAVVPLARRGGETELLGMVAVKHRRNAFSFAPEDLQFLKSGAASAALACEALHVSQTGPVSLDEVVLECDHCGLVVDWIDATTRCECGGTRRPGAIPKRLAGRFEVVRRLGAGGMGVVYLATDPKLGRSVALKTLTWLSEPAAERSLNEARAMASVTHPNIAVLYGSESWQSTPILVLEYLSGGTLDRRLRSRALTPLEAVQMAIPLANALEHVHAGGRYHGDVKPSNIGFTMGGTPKLLDFGLSQALAGTAPGGEDEGNRPAMPAGGTPAYLSPEVWAGAEPNEALDLWALSVVLCEALAGRHPYGGAKSASDIARRSERSIRALADTPQPIRDVLTEALCDTGRGRPRTATEFRQRLESVAPHSG